MPGYNYGNFRPQGGGNGQYNGGRGAFSNQGYQTQNGRSYNNVSAPAAKKSGCKKRDSYVRHSTNETVNAPCITGWKKPAGQLFMKFVAVPAKDPSTKKDRWKKFVVTIQIENQAEIVTTGFWDVDKKVLRMPDFGGGMVANPSGGPGGYWGRSGPPRNNRR